MTDNKSEKQGQQQQNCGERTAAKATATAQGCSGDSIKAGMERVTEVLSETVRKNSEEIFEAAREMSAKQENVLSVLAGHMQLVSSISRRNALALGELGSLSLQGFKQCCEPFVQQATENFEKFTKKSS